MNPHIDLGTSCESEEPEAPFEEISSLIRSHFNYIHIYVVSNVEEWEDVLKLEKLDVESLDFVGLDCEWESQDKHGVSLIQVC